MRRAFVIVVCLLLLPAVGRADAVYSATTATLSNGAEIHDCPFCHDGKIAGHIGGDDNGRVVFSNIIVQAAGLYEMTVYYQVSDDRSFDIIVNHEPVPQTVIFRRRTRDAGIGSQSVLVPLASGTNSIAFENPREFGPDLEQISIAAERIPSQSIAGTAQDSAGSPVAGARIDLSGQVERQTVTDAAGHYEFNYLPKGEYRITPAKGGFVFEPFDRIVGTNANRADFSVRPFPAKTPDLVEIATKRWRIVYDRANGTATILHDGVELLTGAHAEVRLPATVTSMDYARRKIRQQPVQDCFGFGRKVEIESNHGEGEGMTQIFWLYDDADYLLAQVKLTGRKRLSSNFMAPLVSRAPVNLLPSGDNRALFVPFDNDKWIRYDAIPFGGDVTSYEVSAFYNNASRQGLVVGSIDHDTWKTGVKAATSGGTIEALEIFGGITSASTRDTLPHGKVTGTLIESPRIFLGFFSDWRDGLDKFAMANAKVAPPRQWTKNVPFGWNSWGKLQFNISFAKAVEASDFFAHDLQPHHFEDNDTVYIGLDAGWGKFSDEQLKEFAGHCKANHQEAGIYFTPFADFGRKSSATVEGSHYQYKDIYLYADGDRQRIAGGVALDPTHPGTKARIKYYVDRFKRFGFKYVKADFMVHGALEGDRFYDPHVTTGLQAYNSGMKYLDQCLGPEMYLNLAISPLFPAQYANSRRIACDSWGDIGKVEYTLNSLTYGWWLGHVYDFNDPDHVVLGGYAGGENRARVTSAVITGLFISGDDFSEAGDPIGKEKARKFLTNPDIDALGRMQKAFRPVEGDTGDRAASMFTYEDARYFYLAAFNYSQAATNREVAFGRIGLRTVGPVEAKELWSGEERKVSSPMNIHIPAADVVVYRFRKAGV